VRVLLQPQSGTTDTLSAINNCTIDGAVVQLSTTDVGDIITVANSASIKFPDGQPYVLDNIYTILTLVRKGGVWVPAMGSSPSGGIEIANNCSHATAFDQVCIDRVQRIIYLGTGTGIVAIARGAGEGGDGCFGLDDCFDLGPTIDGLNGRTNALRLLDSGGDGFLIYTGTSGPVIECVKDFGTVTEAGCTPTHQGYFALYPANFSPDGTHFVHSFNVTLNAERVPVTLNPGDNDAAGIVVAIPMKDSWDGVNLRIHGYLHTAAATPSGIIKLDWSGYCVTGTSASGTGAYATETVNGVMSFNLASMAQHRQIIQPTANNIPLAGCTTSANRTLWLRGMVDATATTSGNMSQQHFFVFQVRYGHRSFD
jgi:hypothetical protein